jgi:hypothetical protein
VILLAVYPINDGTTALRASGGDPITEKERRAIDEAAEKVLLPAKGRDFQLTTIV